MDENQDLAKQYQDILDRYSRELVSQPETPAETIPQPEPQVALPPSEPKAILEETPTTFSTPLVDPTPPQQNNFFKYLFFISLLIFFGVLGTIIYTIFKSGKVTNSIIPTPTSIINDNSTSPTATIDKVCVVNDKQYPIGESFLADDKCNTCTCGNDTTIICTQKACEATPSIKLVPTTVIKVTPTTDPNQASLVEKNTVTSLINNFEKAVQSKDVFKVMTYFSQPTTQSDKDIYISMTTGPDDARLFKTVSSSFSTISWKIKSITKGESSFTAIVDETRSQSGGPANPTITKVTSPFVFVIGKYGSAYVLDKYYPQGDESMIGKYRGLGF